MRAQERISVNSRCVSPAKIADAHRFKRFSLIVELALAGLGAKKRSRPTKTWVAIYVHLGNFKTASELRCQGIGDCYVWTTEIIVPEFFVIGVTRWGENDDTSYA